jgi:hypothetical protein
MANATKPRNFKSLALAHAWLEGRGYGKTGQEHVWAKAGSMAFVELVLGGYRPSVRVAIEVAAASLKLAA